MTFHFLTQPYSLLFTIFGLGATHLVIIGDGSGICKQESLLVGQRDHMW